MSNASKPSCLYGTLDLLILKNSRNRGHDARLRHCALHRTGFPGDSLRLSQGSIYPALIRLCGKRAGLLLDWGVSETKRKVRFYSPDPSGTEATPHRSGELGKIHCLCGPLSGDIRMSVFASQRSRDYWRCFAKPNLDLELEDEIRAHLELAAEDARSHGLSPGRRPAGSAPPFRRD